NKEYIKALLTRETVATIDKKLTDKLFGSVYDSLVYLNNERLIRRLNVLYDSRFSNLLEILSRLTIKLNEQELDKCLNLARQIYLSLENEKNTHCFGPELNNLFRRIFYAYDNKSILIKLNDLLKLPIHLVKDYITDPFYYLVSMNFKTEDKLIIKKHIDMSIVNSLLDELKTADRAMITLILRRLTLLSNLELLEEKDKVKIGEFLIGDGFDNSGFYFNSLLSNFLLSESSFKEDIISHLDNIFRKELVDVFGEEYGRKYSYHSGKVDELRKHFIEINGLLDVSSKCLNFSYFKDSLHTLISNIESWWERNKEYLDRDDHTREFPWIIYKRFLISLLYHVPLASPLFEKVALILEDLKS
ncbi:hypothetical protein V7195_26850, partial [Priestia megaterium]|uniref:hypothetical protein n=1 Tax=Priestia megaterium TaxID=1404 RepID=UPI003008B085